MDNGFTLIELLLVTTIVGIVAALGAGFGLGTYRSFSFHQDTKLITNLLEQARTEAMQMRNGSPYGIEVTSGSVTLFSGSIYQPRAVDDQMFPTGLALIGQNSAVVVFQPLSGLVQSPVSMTLSNGILHKNIGINAQGTIED